MRWCILAFENAKFSHALAPHPILSLSCFFLNSSFCPSRTPSPRAAFVLVVSCFLSCSRQFTHYFRITIRPEDIVRWGVWLGWPLKDSASVPRLAQSEQECNVEQKGKNSLDFDVSFSLEEGLFPFLQHTLVPRSILQHAPPLYHTKHQYTSLGLLFINCRSLLCLAGDSRYVGVPPLYLLHLLVLWNSGNRELPTGEGQ